jgi:hypothetical protein
MSDSSGTQVSMFWQAASTEGNELPGPSFFPQTQIVIHPHVVQSYPRSPGALTRAPDRVTMRVRLEPIGLDVLDDLIKSHDLDPAMRAAMPRFDVSSTPILEWTQAAANDTYTEGDTVFSCVTNGLSAQQATVVAKANMTCKP